MDSDVSGALNIVSEVYNEGIDLYVWIGEFLKYLRSMLFIKSGVSDIVTDATVEISDKIKEQAKKADIKWLTDCISILLDAHKNIKNSFIPQLPVEIAVIRICSKNFEKDYKKNDCCESENNLSNKTGPTVKTEKVSVSSKLKAESKEEKSSISFAKIEKNWGKFIKDSKELNHSLNALLNLCKPIGLEGKSIIVEVFYPFHKERLESASTRKLIAGLSKEVFGVDLNFKCVLSKEKPKKFSKDESGKLTDLNVTNPKDVNEKSILDVFDGGLPITG